MESWDEVLREAANRACNTLKSTELQRNYCRVGFYRGIIEAAKFGQKKEVRADPMGFDDIISSAEFLDNEIGFFEGNVGDSREDRELKIARQEGGVYADRPKRYLVVESVDGIVTRSQVAPSRKMAQAVESNFMDTQVRADSEYSILTLKKAREMGYNV